MKERVMKNRSKQCSPLFLWVFLASFVSQNLVFPVMCRSFEDQKTYYSPDPHTQSPPSGSHGSPSHGGGGSYNPTPSTPSTGGGGYYHSPPSTGGGGGGHSTPVTFTPPSTPSINPVTPVTPGISTPSAPLLPDPNAPPFIIGTCNYWRTHPEAIWALLGWWGTVGGIFGAACTPAFGTNLSLQQALANTRTDGIGALYREGTASFLNSLVSKKFPFTTKQVKDVFVAAVVSNKAAAAQAKLFKLANEGGLKTRA